MTVFKAPELSKTVQVSETGTINFPLIGELDAAGKSAREIEQEMTKKLGSKYLQNPQISVFVKDYFSQRITMEGAIKKPGVYPIAGGLVVLQAMAQAGGFDEIGLDDRCTLPAGGRETFCGEDMMSRPSAMELRKILSCRRVT